jgi:carbonic anhydrase
VTSASRLHLIRATSIAAACALLAGCGALGGGEDSAGAADPATSERIGAMQEQIYDLEDRLAELDGGAGASRDDGAGAADATADHGTDTTADHGASSETEDSSHDETTVAHGDTSTDDGDSAHAEEMTGGTVFPTGGAGGAGGSPSTESAHWTYGGDTGAEHWGALDAAYLACAEGQHQSPVDLGAAAPTDLGDLVFAYTAGEATMVNNGHTVQIDMSDAGGITIDGHEYTLAQLHVHAPSEHTAQGDSFEMEVHLVHKDADGNLAVVGVFVQESAADNPAVTPIVVGIPTEADDTSELIEPFDPSVLLPAANFRNAFSYDGSLTTPPCTEGVKWNVLNGTITMSATQIAAFKAAFPEPNNRPVQPLNDRSVKLDTSIG